MTDCGTGSNESCCTSTDIPGGQYYRTYTNSGSGATGEADPAVVSGFRIDEYLVTVGRFRQFVIAWNGGGSSYPPAAGSGKHLHLNSGQGLVNCGAGGAYEPGWSPSDDSSIDLSDGTLGSCMDKLSRTTSRWTPTASTQENLPINCVTWAEAYAFCIWDGGFLPSEAEWEYAAGGSGQLEYPWGNADPSTSDLYAVYNCDYSGGTCDGLSSIANVGMAPLGVTSTGLFDMAGEVWEWTLDWYVEDYVNPCFDCANLTQAGSPGRVVRGGDFESPDPTVLLPWNRDKNPPTARSGVIGFRCARVP